MLNTRFWLFIIINNELCMTIDSPMNTSMSRPRHFSCAVDRIAPLRSSFPFAFMLLVSESTPMSLYRRANSPYWWIRFQLDGREVRASTGTEDREQAEELERHARDSVWRQVKLARSLPTYGLTLTSAGWLRRANELRPRTKKSCHGSIST